MGTGPALLLALGKLVVASSRVEHALALVAYEAGVAKPTRSVGLVVKDLRRAIDLHSPSPDLPLVRTMQWSSQLPPMFDLRNKLIHGVHMRSLDAAGGSQPTIRLMRVDSTERVDVESVELAAERMADLSTEGIRLFGQFRMAAEGG